jgi:predicted DNA-binding ribbon-helix-helix protein
MKLQHYPVRIHPHPLGPLTLVVEPEFLDALGEVAVVRGYSMTGLIRHAYQTGDHRLSLSSRVRVFLLRYYREALLAELARKKARGTAPRSPADSQPRQT